MPDERGAGDVDRLAFLDLPDLVQTDPREAGHAEPAERGRRRGD
jgi:hypothetical protein